MSNPIVPPYDESKQIETIFDFQNTQIFRVNDITIEEFLATGKEFDKGCRHRVDEKGRIRIVYVVDKLPALSAILSFIDEPFDEVKWGMYAVVAPKNMSYITRIVPIMTYSLSLTRLRHRFILKVFDSKNRDDFTKIFKWMDEHMDNTTEEGVVS